LSDIRYVEHPLFFMSDPQYDISYVVLITKYDLKFCLTYFRPYCTVRLDIGYVEHPVLVLVLVLLDLRL